MAVPGILFQSDSESKGGRGHDITRPSLGDARLCMRPSRGEAEVGFSSLVEPEEQLQTLVNGPNLVGGDFSEEPANASLVHRSHLVRQRPGHLEETAGARAEQRVEGALASPSRNGHHGDQGEARFRHHLGITHQD